MTPRGRRKLYFVFLVLASLGLAAGLALYALQDNVSFFYSPREVKAFAETGSNRVAVGQRFRLGGMVEDGSLKTIAGSPSVAFTVTDTVDTLRVEYTGILPDLFREGQGVVATGSLRDDGVFIASEILAKHDENYMPPDVARTLKDAAREKAGAR